MVPRRKISIEDEKEIIDRYLSQETPDTICKDFNVVRGTIYDVLKRNNVPTIGYERRLSALDHKSFEELTEDALYWSGFIAADGHINHKNVTPRLEIMLAYQDRAHLEKLRSFVKAKKDKVVDRNNNGYPASRFSFKSKDICNRLEFLGIKGPDLSNELSSERHFWRGVIDGDGWISKDTNYLAIELAGQPYLLERYREFLRESFSISPKMRKDSTKNSYKVKLGGRTGYPVVDYLYTDSSIFLDRKKKRADEYVRIYQEKDRATATK